MEKTVIPDAFNGNYFTIRVSSGNVYMAKVKNEKDIFTVSNASGKDVIVNSLMHNKSAIELSSVFVIMQVKEGPLPVKYELMPGGSSSLWLNTSQISEFNVIDNGSKIVEALNAIDSGVLTSAAAPDLSNSSRGIGGK